MLSQFADFQIHRASSEEAFEEEPETTMDVAETMSDEEFFAFEGYRPEEVEEGLEMQEDFFEMEEQIQQEPPTRKKTKNPKSSEKEILDGVEKIKTEIGQNEENGEMEEEKNEYDELIKLLS